MQELGQLLLLVTFFVTLATALTGMAGAITRNAAMMRSARYGVYASTALYIAMAIILTHGFLTHDFSNKYIATYSDRSMPTIYLLAAFWGGEKGALLFWTTSLSIFSTIAIYVNRKKDPVYISWVVAILMLAVFFFDVLMVFESSPFETFMTSAGPADGKGLNPLLQNPTMAFHPPSLLTGYITFTIPFAFGMAALITGRLDSQWISETRRWTLVSFAFLSVGLVLGMLWAYEEIGWGFWWMWDPVENAGLVPWFTATAFLHSVMIQERRGMFKRWNVILVCLTFLLTIFGTFLTRSQLIDSIHAFADSTLADYFLYYMLLILVVSIVLIAWRWKDLKGEARIESFWSRESFFVLNNVALLFCAFIVLWGTLISKITESPAVRNVYNNIVGVFGGDPIMQAKAWHEADFNEYMVPIGLALLLLMGAGPLISWRRATLRNFQKNFFVPLLGSLVVTVVGTVTAIVIQVSDMADKLGVGFGEAYSQWADELTIGHFYVFFCYLFAVFAAWTIAREFHRSARVRQKKSGERYPSAVVASTMKAPRRFGGYIIHMGVVLMFIAFSGKFFKIELPERLLGVGDTMQLADYHLTFDGPEQFFDEDEGYAASRANITVLEEGETVAAEQVDELASFLQSRDVGVFHVETKINNPKMIVRFKDEAARDRMRDDYYLSRTFRTDFLPVPTAPDDLVVRYRIADMKLVSVMPMLAMQKIRLARASLGEGSSVGADVRTKAGTVFVDLAFKSLEEKNAFLRRMQGLGPASWTLPDGGATARQALALRLPNLPPDQIEGLFDAGRVRVNGSVASPQQVLARGDELKQTSLIPETIIAAISNPENGALEFVDSRTGVIKQPEVRFYEKHQTPTTEASISSSLHRDLYLAIQPRMEGGGVMAAISQPFINLLPVVFPLVSFLWAGAVLVLLGVVVTLIPSWLGRTLASLTRSVKRTPASSPTALLALLIGAAALAAPSTARATSLQQPGLPQVHGLPPTEGDATVDVLSRLYCACSDTDAEREITLADAECACPAAGEERQVVAQLMARRPEEAQRSGRARADVLYTLVHDVSPAWDARLIYDHRAYSDMKQSIVTTCPGERGLVLSQAQLGCSVRAYWFQRFRVLLAAGASQETIFRHYVDVENVRQAPETPWTYDDLRGRAEMPLTWILPTVLAVSFVMIFSLVMLRRTRRQKAEAAERGDLAGQLGGREAAGREAGELDERERLRLQDELDAYEI